MEGEIFLDQRDFLGLAEPLHQQRHGGHEIAVVQQGIDDQGVGLGAAEVLDVAAPEGHVAGGGAPFVPRPQRRRHALGRLERGLAGDAVDRADLDAGELVPPLGQRGEVPRERLLQGGLAGRRRRLVDLHVEHEDVAEHVQQVVDAVVVDAVLDGGKEAVLAAEAQDVPGIHHRPALDRPVQAGLRRGATAAAASSSRPRSIASWAADIRHRIWQVIRAEAVGTISACRAACCSAAQRGEQLAPDERAATAGPAAPPDSG